MTELQLTFLINVIINYVVISSIANLAFGRGNIWVIGHGALLSTGGIYALVAYKYSLASGIVVAVCLLIVFSILLSACAALLRGDRFVIVSLGFVYAAYALSIAVFGEGIRDIPGALTYKGKLIVFAVTILFAMLLTTYILGLSYSRLDAILKLSRDDPVVLEASGISSSPFIFWLHFVSCIPVGLIGILSVIYETGYSANLHSISTCLLLFIVIFGFGTNSVVGSIAAAFCVTSLQRAVELLLISEWANALYVRIFHGFGFTENTRTASNIAVQLTQGILAIILILAVRYRPEGLFGDRKLWIRR